MARKCNELLLPAAIADAFPGDDKFACVMALQGEVFRNVRGRRTLRFEYGGNSYFAKLHYGVGWREIFKNLISFKVPIISAKTEKQAIEKLDSIGIATTPLVGFGERGCSPASLQSFLITKDLGNIVSLEDLCSSWKANPPSASFKRRLIIAVAQLARTLHINGLNHRDFYMCHVCLDAGRVDEYALKNEHIKLYLIDLHRMLIHSKPVSNDNMKDIAALYFSSLDMDFTARDYLRFKHYYAKGVQAVTSVFWQQVTSRADRLYAKFHSDKFQQRLAVEKAALKK